MTYLITLLISLLGYGTPADFNHLTEEQLNQEIELAGGGNQNEWDFPSVNSTPGE